MSTASELAKLIGKHGLLHVTRPQLSFRVEVLDARQQFGRIDLQVKPEDGEGTAWVQKATVTLDPDK